MAFIVRALGSNGSGQLGIGHLEDCSSAEECLFVDGKPSSRPIKIAAGGNHTLLLCEDGSAYATGNNDNGRCGLSSSLKTLTKFHSVSFENEHGYTIRTFKFIGATWEASIFVTEDGQLYTCGSGNFGELGQGKDVLDCPFPRRLSAFSFDSEVIDIAASMRHCVVILANGEAYGWGAARKGQLGIPREKAVFAPRRISLPLKDGSYNDQFSARRVVCCRDFSCLVDVSSPSCLYAILGSDSTGDLTDQQLYPVGSWKSVAASWTGVFALDADCNLIGRGKNWIPSTEAIRFRPLHIAAGSEHVLAETSDGKILAVGWGEHGNCGKPTDETGTVRDRWNTIGTGHVLGAGCATSFIFNN